MQIIILGAGQVGTSLAESLVAEQHSITVIDTNEERLDNLQNHFDLRTLVGFCSHPSVLEEAGAAQADILIAVSNNDEANLIACQVAHTLFKVPKKIARIRAQDYLKPQGLFGNHALPVDVFFSPEQLVTHEIQRLIEYPGTLQVIDFVNGKIKLVGIKISPHSNTVGKCIHEFTDYFISINSKCLAIFRNHEWLTVTHDLVTEAGDEIYFIVEDKYIQNLSKFLGQTEGSNKHIMIAGGGHLGGYLAKVLESHYQIKVIEQNRQRCDYLSQHLQHSIILYGNACDTRLLNEENIKSIDVFCALTNDDENNIISCLQAKELGATQVIALITRPAYADLIENGTINIDIAISPQLATADSILTHIRKGNMLHVHSVHRGSAEIFEVIIQGDKNTSKFADHQLQQIDLPLGIIIAAIARGNDIIIPQATTLIQAGDHAILFVYKKNLIHYIEDLLQTSS